MGMFRRLANSLFMHWRAQHHKPQHHTTTDFQSHIDEENLRRGLILVSASQPNLKPLLHFLDLVAEQALPGRVAFWRPG